MLNILIVEDGDNRIEVLRSLYSQQRLTVCRDGQSAIQAVRTGVFNLIHLDHDLDDELTGADVAEVIHLVCPAVPVIIHSENLDGANAIARILPQALQVPISKFVEASPATSRLKALLSDPGLGSADRAMILFQAIPK